MRSFSLAVLVAALSLSSVAGAEPSAQAKEQARHLLEVGDKKMEEKDYKGALEAFLAADKIMGVPTTGISAAAAYLQLGKLVEAHDLLLRVSRYTPPEGAPQAFIDAQKEAADQAAGIEPRLASLTIKLNDKSIPELRVTIDGAPTEVAGLGFATPVNPGDHEVVASAPGYVDAKGSASVAEKEAKDVVLELKKDPNYKPPTKKSSASRLDAETVTTPPDPGAPLKIAGYVLTGIGIGGLIAGGVTGGLALSKKSSLLTQCGGRLCSSRDDTATSDISSMSTLATVSTATFIAGGVLAAGGIAALAIGFTRKREDNPPRAWIAPVVGPAYLGAQGTF